MPPRTHTLHDVIFFFFFGKYCMHSTHMQARAHTLPADKMHTWDFPPSFFSAAALLDEHRLEHMLN
jgi:hypothetical protein